MLLSYQSRNDHTTSQGWVEILMIILVYSKRVSVRNNLLYSVGTFKSNNQNLFPFMLLPPEEAPKALTADPTSGDLFS